jgi:hypothetical protein
MSSIFLNVICAIKLFLKRIFSYVHSTNAVIAKIGQKFLKHIFCALFRTSGTLCRPRLSRKQCDQISLRKNRPKCSPKINKHHLSVVKVTENLGYLYTSQSIKFAQSGHPARKAIITRNYCDKMVFQSVVNQLMAQNRWAINSFKFVLLLETRIRGCQIFSRCKILKREILCQITANYTKCPKI